MNLTGIPIADIVAETYVDFSQIYVGQQGVYEFSIFNVGTSTLTVDGNVDGSEFELLPFPLEIEPYEHRDMVVYFTPTENGSVSGQINLITNDENNSSFSIELVGEGLVSPVASLSLDSIGVYLGQEDQITRTFQVSNLGGSNLSWNMTLGGAMDTMNMRSSESNFRSQWENQNIHLELLNRI